MTSEMRIDCLQSRLTHYGRVAISLGLIQGDLRCGRESSGNIELGAASHALEC